MARSGRAAATKARCSRWRRTANCRPSSTRRSSRCTRLLRRRTAGLRRHIAGRKDLPGRRGRHLEDVLRSGRQIHLGARRGQVGQRVCRDRRQGSDLQDHARRPGRTRSTRPTPATSSRLPSTRPASSSRAPSRRGASSGSTAPARHSSCSTHRSAKSMPSGSPRTGRSTRSRSTAHREAKAARRIRRSPNPRAHRSRLCRQKSRRYPSWRGRWGPPPHRRRRGPTGAADVALSIASGPTVSGTRCGIPARMHPTI